MTNATNLGTTTPFKIFEFLNKQTDIRGDQFRYGARACGGQMINANICSHVAKSKILNVQRNWFQNSLRALNLALHF